MDTFRSGTYITCNRLPAAIGFVCELTLSRYVTAVGRLVRTQSHFQCHAPRTSWTMPILGTFKLKALQRHWLFKLKTIFF